MRVLAFISVLLASFSLAEAAPSAEHGMEKRAAEKKTPAKKPAVPKPATAVKCTAADNIVCENTVRDETSAPIFLFTYHPFQYRSLCDKMHTDDSLVQIATSE